MKYVRETIKLFEIIKKLVVYYTTVNTAKALNYLENRI